VVEMSINWSLDDFIAFESILDLMPGYVPPRQIEEMWRDDFDFAADDARAASSSPPCTRSASAGAAGSECWSAWSIICATAPT
jgi:hypothetical protein